jgi:hypothetical protein
MNITIKINTDNDAFKDSETDEVKRILKKFCRDKLDWFDDDKFDDGYYHRLVDVNGNMVGHVTTE